MDVEETHDHPHCGESTQMRRMWWFLWSSWRSEKALANPQLGKATQVLTAIMQLHKQVILEITSKHTPQKSQINAIGANFPQSQKKILPNIFSTTVERSHITVKNAGAHSIEQEPWRGTSAFTLEKSHIIVHTVMTLSHKLEIEISTLKPSVCKIPIVFNDSRCWKQCKQQISKEAFYFWICYRMWHMNQLWLERDCLGVPCAIESWIESGTFKIT